MISYKNNSIYTDTLAYSDMMEFVLLKLSI